MACESDIPVVVADNRANYLECAISSCEQYSYKCQRSRYLFGSKICQPKEIIPELATNGWKVEGDVIYKPKIEFLSTIYSNEKRRQIMIAYRGTNTIQALIQGCKEIYCNGVGEQKRSAYFSIDKAIAIVKRYKWENARITFTGHSLGGFLAGIALFFAENDKKPGDKSVVYNAVTFESPGVRESLEELQPTQQDFEVKLSKLDLISFVAYPNRINTINSHVGTLIMMDVKIPEQSGNSITYLKDCHAMASIIEWHKEWNNEETYKALRPHIIKSWPTSVNAKAFRETYRQNDDGSYQLGDNRIESITEFDLKYKKKFDVLKSDCSIRQILPLRHFDGESQKFLLCCDKDKIPDDTLRDFTVQELGGNELFVILGGTEKNVLKFRTEISFWISQQDDIRPYLVHSKQSTSSPTADVTFFRGKNVKISGDSKVIRNNVSATNMSIEEGVDPAYAALFVDKLCAVNAKVSFVENDLEIGDKAEVSHNNVTKHNLQILKTVV